MKAIVGTARATSLARLHLRTVVSESKLRLAFVLVCLVMPNTALAGVNTWTSYGPEGGEIQVLAIDPVTPGTLYAGTYAAGIFKSTDRGVSWSASTSGLVNADVQALAIDPVTPGTLYAGTYLNGVFKSTDGGVNWTAGSSGSVGSVYALLIDPTTPTTLYAGTNYGVSKSTDGGATWNAGSVGLSYTVYGLLNDPMNSTIYAGTAGGVFKSTDGGVNWSASTSGLNYGVYSLLIDPVTPMTLYAGTDGGVFKSTDGGANWSPSNSGLTNLINALIIDPGTPTTLYAGTYTAGVFKSTDGGVNWSPSNSGIINMYVQALAIDPATSGTLYAGTYLNGVFKSTDGGVNWTAINTGLTNTAVDSLAIDPVTTTTVYAGTNNFGVFKSTDGGVNWSPSTSGLVNTYVQALVVDPVTTTTLYAASEETVFKSTDGGVNWSPSNSGLINIPVITLAIDPVTPGTVYAGTGYGVFKSTDGGANWNASSIGLPNADVAALIVDPVNPMTLYAGAPNGGVFKSTDGGANWSRSSSNLTSAPYALAIDPVTTTTVYAATPYGSVFKSTDGGMSWQLMNYGLPNTFVAALAIDPVTPGTLYAGTGYGVFKSTDGGTSWHVLNSGMTSNIVRALAIDPATPTKLYAGTSNGGVFAIQQVNPSLTVDPPIIDAGNSVTVTCKLGAAGAGATVAFFATQGPSIIPPSQQLTADGSGTATWIPAVPTSWVPSVTVQCRADSVAGQPTSAFVPLTVDCANSACPNGTSCTAPGQCQSGFCVDGVCCGTSSCPVGQACNVSAQEGQCQTPALVCPNGNGLYCGESVGLTTGTLYQCTNGAYTVSQVCPSGCQVNPPGTNDSCVATDTTPPVRSNGSPSGTLPAGTSSTAISLTTDESATCRYSTTSGIAYAAMTGTFATTGGTSHSTIVSGLNNGQAYSYYVRCQDLAGNANTNDFTIAFSIASAQTCNNNGVKDPDEYCDGRDIGIARCSDLPGFDCGILNCSANCTFDTSECGQNECAQTAVQCSEDGTEVDRCAPGLDGCLRLTRFGAHRTRVNVPSNLGCGVGLDHSQCIKTDTNGNCLVWESPTDARGVNFQLWCGDWDFCRDCFVFYRNDLDQKELAGKCLFVDGRNVGTLTYIVQNNAPDGSPACFEESLWENHQREPTPLQCLLHIPPFEQSCAKDPDIPAADNLYSGVTFLDADGKLDTWRYVHHVNTNKTDITVLKDDAEVFHKDPSSGPSFNDLSPVLLQSLDKSGGTQDTTASCDLNFDGKCDVDDINYLRAGLGSCRGDANWRGLADLDNDGCITATDVPLMALSQCPCTGPLGGGAWSSHGAYRGCISGATKILARAGLLGRGQSQTMRREAARSTCGQQDKTRCCARVRNTDICKIISPNRCAAKSGVDIGAGSCVPSSCSTP